MHQLLPGSTDLMIPRLYITDSTRKQPQTGQRAVTLRHAIAVVELKLSNGRGVRGAHDVQPHPRCGGAGKDVNHFVADGSSPVERLPFVPNPGLDLVSFNVLAAVEPLHGDGTVKCDRLWEPHFKRGVVGVRRRNPERIGIVVECRTRVTTGA
jgi:hypothetical protein